MKKSATRLRAIIAGSLPVAVTMALLVPLNMGGCSGGSDLGSSIGGAVTSVASGNPGALTGGSGHVSTGELVTRGISVGQHVGNAVSLDAEKERALGQEVALAASGRYPVSRDEQLNRYVQMVAQVLADSTPAGGRPVVMVLDTNVINAYSGPSGYIMVTRGLLLQLQDESELAGVLSHELGHVIEQHGLKAVRDSELGAALLQGATITLNDSQLMDLGKDMANKILTSGYDQGQENEADVDAVRIAAAAGYDPQGYLRALQRLAAIQGGQAKPFSTHPGLTSRVQSVSSQIQREHLAGGQTNRERFEAAVRAKPGQALRTDGQ